MIVHLGKIAIRSLILTSKIKIKDLICLVIQKYSLKKFQLQIKPQRKKIARIFMMTHQIKNSGRQIEVKCLFNNQLNKKKIYSRHISRRSFSLVIWQLLDNKIIRLMTHHLKLLHNIHRNILTIRK